MEIAHSMGFTESKSIRAPCTAAKLRVTSIPMSPIRHANVTTAQLIMFFFRFIFCFAEFLTLLKNFQYDPDNQHWKRVEELS